MKQFGIKTISMLLCLLTTTATACKDNEEMDFTVNEEESVGLAANCSRSWLESAGSEFGGSETGRRRKKTVGWRVSTGNPAL